MANLKASVRAFLTQVIDYAGLFPPAKLPLDQALSNYLRYRKESPYAWMLGRFVCPAAKLPELLTLAKGHADRALLSVAALGTQAASAAAFVDALNADLTQIDEFRRAWGSADIVEIYEVALPAGAKITEMVGPLVGLSGPLCERKLRGFFEVALSPHWRRDLEALTVGLHQVRADLGMKLRCGGTAASAFPDEAQVATFLIQCRDWKLPWKATAGLHHPRRHFDESLNLWHHGFLNVFGAGLLAQTHPLTEADIAAILADREGTHFRFDDDCFSWKNWSCTTAQIIEQRGMATSFGSCSFDEPVDDLRAMGLLG